MGKEFISAVFLTGGSVRAGEAWQQAARAGSGEITFSTTNRKQNQGTGSRVY